MQYRWVRTVMVMLAAVGLSACSGDSVSQVNPFHEPNYGTDSHHGNRHAPVRNGTPYADPIDEQALAAPVAAMPPQPLVPPPSAAPYGYPAQPMMDPYAGYAPAPAPMTAPMPPAPAPMPMAAAPASQAPDDYYAMEMASSQYAAPQPMAPQAAPAEQVNEYGVAGYSRPITEQSAMGYDNGVYQPRSSTPSIPVNLRPTKLGYKVLPDSRYAPRRSAERWQR